MTTGTPVPEAQGGTGKNSYTALQLLVGNSTTNGLDKLALTGGTNISVITVPVLGTVQISATGSASGGGNPLNQLIIGSGAGAPDTFSVNWSQNISTRGPLIGNYSSATSLPAVSGNVVIQVAGGDGLNCEQILMAGGGEPQLAFIRADGTVSTPTAITAGDLLGEVRALGYNGAAYVGPRGSLQFVATENWTTTANGTGVVLNFTPNGSTTLTALTIGGGGTGTVTSLTAGTGITLSPSAITQTGSISLTVPVAVTSGGTGLTGGTSGGIPYFSSATAIASSLALPANGLIVGGGAGTAPFVPLNGGNVMWTIPSTILQGNYNTAAVPAAINTTLGAAFLTQGADGIANAFIQIAYGTADQNVSYRAENTGASPTATSPGQAIANFIARGFDGTNWVSTNMGTFRILTQNQTSATDHSTEATISLTPRGVTNNVVVATFLPSPDGGCSFAGDTTGGTGSAGLYGEEGSNVVLVASGIGLTAGSPIAIASQSLGAGDWEVSGEVWFTASAATITQAHGVISVVSNASMATVVPTDTGARHTIPWTTTPPATIVLPLGPCRQTNPSATTVFLVGQVNFSAGTITGFGKLHWRRMR